MLFLLPAGLAAAYIVSRFVVGHLVLPFKTLLPHSVLLTAGTGLAYLVIFGLVVGAPLIFNRRHTLNRSVLGIAGRFSWSDLGWGLLFFLVSAISCPLVVRYATKLVPALRVHHAQDLPIVVSGAPINMILAFATMAIMAPLAEELICRGYLYGKLLKSVPAVPAAVVTSLMFALAHLFGATHLQWNVTISAFVFSLFACLLRTVTGKIWAGVVMHALTNALGFLVIFAPFIGA